MSQEPLVSIIIPTYNRAHLIGETLDSVLAQTYQNWECIVVDDGSTDDTDAVMKGYCDKDSRFKYYHRPEEHLPGGNGARNYGFKMSQGEYIQWFDSDDLMMENLVEKCVNYILKSDKDYVVTNFMKLTSKQKIKYNNHYPSIDKIFEYYLTQKISLNTLTLFYRRNTIGIEFDENLSNAQDLDFISRYLSNDKIGVVNNDYLIVVKQHSSNITSNYINKDLNSIITELNVRKKTLKIAQYKFKNPAYSIIKRRLVLKAIKLIKIESKSFFVFMRTLHSEQLINFIDLLKIYFLGYVYAYTGKGRELLKKII